MNGPLSHFALVLQPMAKYTIAGTSQGNRLLYMYYVSLQSFPKQKKWEKSVSPVQCPTSFARTSNPEGSFPQLIPFPRIHWPRFCQKQLAGKMAEFHVYFLPLLVLSCCLQILAGYGIRCLQFWYVFSWPIMCDVLVLLLFLQERFLHDSRRPSRRQQKPNQASLQKIGDEVAPR